MLPAEMHLALLLAFLVVVSPARAQQPVLYSLEYRAPGAKRVSVRIELQDPAPGTQTLVIPRAVPMGYGDEPYDHFLENVRANSPTGEALPVAREEGPRWLVGRANNRVGAVAYEIHLEQMEREILSGGNSSRLREGYLSLLGYSVFGFFEGLEVRPARLKISAPPAWPVLTTLAPQVPPPAGMAQSEAANYYVLADSQVVMGPRAHIERIETQPPLYVVIYSETPADSAIASAEAAEAFRRTVTFFDGAPFSHYTVLLEWLAPLSPQHNYQFSLEHLESASFCLAASQALRSSAGDTERWRARYNFAHHMAHAWIPKRVFGEGYFPFLWEASPVIDTIWFSEGFAQYVAIEALAEGLPEKERSGYRQRIMDARFRRPLSAMPNWLRRMPLVELSRIASTRYAADFRTAQTVFSRGALMAAEMDDRIRLSTSGAKSLRDALRFLVAWGAREHRAWRIDEFADLVRQGTGADTGDIVQRWLAPLDN